MKLLVFEYSCVSLDSNLLSEGFNILKSLLDDLDDNSFFDVYYLINEEIDGLYFNNLTPIIINDDIFSWLNNYCEEFDFALFVAPEDDLVQYKLSLLLEDKGVNILGCDSTSSYTCSSKELTYKKVSDKILKIKSIKEQVENTSYEIITSKIKENVFVVKPDNRTSSDLIYRIHDKKEFENALKTYEENSIEYFLAQEYIPGTPISVSLVCKNDYVKCISINSQLIEYEENKIIYKGCESPIGHPLKNELYRLSEKIVKQIKGLNAFVGIDYIINQEKIYFVEINSRITTPYIVLQKECSQNLTNSIIDLIVNDKEINLTFKNKNKFIK